MTDPDINVKAAGKEGVEISILTGPRLAEGAPHRGEGVFHIFVFVFYQPAAIGCINILKPTEKRRR